MFFTPTAVNVFAFKINTVDNGSLINAGAVQIIDKVVSYKRNQAVSELNGDLSPLSLPISNVTDPDVLDSNTGKTSAF
nr:MULTISPECIES: hypothetical protein [unclassified Paenibacillus]